MPMRVSLLGHVTAHIGARPVELGPARQRALFAVLAAHAGRAVGRDELIEAVWGASPPVTASGSVYTYVSGLRRALGDDRDHLRSGPTGYAVHLDPDDVDTKRFQRLTAEAAALTGAGRSAAALARLDQALDLWRGDPYAGLTGPFIELDRERLTQLRTTALTGRARLRLAAGGDDDLIPDLAGLVRDHPLHEPLHELLMRALHRAGRRAEALEVFRQAHRTFVRELGVEPGPALRELQRRLFDGGAGRPAARATGLAPTVVPTPVARALRDGLDTRVCFGRSDEIGHLRGMVRAVAAGTGGAVWIEGEPGIGKTELLTLAFADAAGLGCQLAWGAADELGRRVPLQVLTRALGLRATSPDRRIAAVAAHLHDPGGPELPVDRVLAHVRATASVAPLVLVIDDVQWADDTTVLVWERLLTVTTRLPLLLVAAARPEPHARELARLRRSVQARQRVPLILPPLTEPDIHRLMATLLGARPGDRLRALAAQTGGNPLYARELVGALRQRAAIRIAAGVAEVAAAVRAEPPPSLRAAVLGTLGLLSPGTLEVLRSAAFLGTEFAVDDVVAVTGRSPFDLMAALEEALAANVVVDAGADLAFRHPFLCEALIDSVPAPERADRRRRTAEALDRHDGAATRVAVQLAAEAPVVDEWLLGWLVDHHAEVAGQAPQMAGELFRRALATGVPTRRQRGTLLVALVRLEVRHGRAPVAEAVQALDAAISPAERAEMHGLLATMTRPSPCPTG